MDKSGLLQLLWSLEPTGEQGFEGLILRLLEALLGTSFDRAKGGYQQGSDMATHLTIDKQTHRNDGNAPYPIYKHIEQRFRDVPE